MNSTHPTRSALVMFVRVVTLAGVGTCVAAQVKLGNPSLLLLAALLWTLLPFGFVLAALTRLESSTPMLLALAAESSFGLALYLDIVFSAAHVTSTAGLALFFVPLWQMLWHAALLVLSFLARRGDRWRTRHRSDDDD